ncbi:hypothetical protein N9J02_00880 [bacterium]|jgi:hypothetical protein|nr:hypothetical protein [bacterium]|tara:strand:- start:476 stop:1042 length:567 start_codon:yes stop_codon:yes gene_type:complete
MKFDFDVDIDMADRTDFLKLVRHTPASIEKDGNFTKHNTGVYFQNVPKFPLQGYSTIEHKQAEQDGWFKVDFLNNHIYEGIVDETHLDKLVATEPMWELFEHKEVVEKLFHISNHYDIVNQHLPTSLEQLAMILAIIRPGKRHLVGKTWEEIEADVWVKPNDNSYFFKKSHSYGYALAIIVQLNNICE